MTLLATWAATNLGNTTAVDTAGQQRVDPSS